MPARLPNGQRVASADRTVITREIDFMRHAAPVLLLVENNAMLRAALRHHLNRRFRVDLVEAACANEAVAIAVQRQPSVTLLDLNLPTGTAIDTIAVIQAIQPAGRVIAMLDCLDSPYVDAVVKAGAWSYVPKDMLGHQLDPLLRRALAAESPIQDVASNLRQAVAPSIRPDKRRSHLFERWPRIRRTVRWLDENGPWAGQPRIRRLYLANLVALALLVVEKHRSFGL